MMEESPRRQSIFKIVSLSKHRPIFLYRLNDSNQSQEEEEDKGKNLRIHKVREEMQKAASRLNILEIASKPALLDKRSDSCDLSGKSKGKTERAEGSNSRGKIQRTIKEYLRIAYKRT
jgi:hypothetical protein